MSGSLGSNAKQIQAMRRGCQYSNENLGQKLQLVDSRPCTHTFMAETTQAVNSASNRVNSRVGPLPTCIASGLSRQRATVASKEVPPRDFADGMHSNP
eukprot:scaffold1169_cov367-Prasinococcus_capsulatus_cf.AAC.2